MRSFLLLSITAWVFNPFPLVLGSSNQTCRYLPNDDGWPTQEVWSQLNKTVGGRLIATIPLASICHNADVYDETECAALAKKWTLPQTHFPSPSSIMDPTFQNQSCDPFTPKSRPCELGNYIDYAINVTSADDIAAGLKFAEENNIRLVIKNTGHDYLGKSSGEGSLGLWTHNLKSIEIINNFTSEGYNGPAVKMGAGVQSYEIYETAHSNNLRVVGGLCATVGIAGGYTQGGGHSILNSVYGLGADQALEWEVVTANGTYLIASPTQNSDLYYALSGGGAGTYGVVLSLTVRAYKDGIFTGATLSFNNTSEMSSELFWEGISQFHAHLPDIVDTGAAANYIVKNSSFYVSPFAFPDRTKAEATTVLQPLVAKYQELGIEHTLTITEFPNYLDFFETYFGALPYGSLSVNLIAATIGSRLIPRRVIENNTQSNSALSAAIKTFLDVNPEFIYSAHAINVSHAVAGNSPSTNAVPSFWREALLHSVLIALWDFTSPIEKNEAKYTVIEDIGIPALEAVTPGSGVYSNEGLRTQPDFQKNFYGSNYETLRGIKKVYDPEDLFYALTGVGSEAWVVGSDGRLCRA